MIMEIEFLAGLQEEGRNRVRRREARRVGYAKSRDGFFLLLAERVRCTCRGPVSWLVERQHVEPHTTFVTNVVGLRK